MSMRMPIYRDVRVCHDGDAAANPRDAAANASPSDTPPLTAADSAVRSPSPGMVTAMGFGKDDILFQSDRVGCIQWRDSHGDIVGILVRLKPDMWGFTHKGEQDWDQNLAKFGNPDR